jgi:hypothetical protein
VSGHGHIQRRLCAARRVRSGHGRFVLLFVRASRDCTLTHHSCSNRLRLSAILLRILSERAAAKPPACVRAQTASPAAAPRSNCRPSLSTPSRSCSSWTRRPFTTVGRRIEPLLLNSASDCLAVIDATTAVCFSCCLREVTVLGWLPLNLGYHAHLRSLCFHPRGSMHAGISLQATLFTSGLVNQALTVTLRGPTGQHVFDLSDFSRAASLSRLDAAVICMRRFR